MTEEELDLLVHNVDEGDWNDLRYRDNWRQAFKQGFREAEKLYRRTEEEL